MALALYVYFSLMMTASFAECKTNVFGILALQDVDQT